MNRNALACLLFCLCFTFINADNSYYVPATQLSFEKASLTKEIVAPKLEANLNAIMNNTEEDVAKISLSVKKNQSLIDEKIAGLDQVISAALLDKQDLLKLNDIEKIAEQINTKHTSKSDIYKEIKNDLNSISYKGLYLVVLDSINVLSQKQKLIADAINTLTPKAIEDINGVFLTALTKMENKNLSVDYIKKTVTGEMGVEKNYLSKTLRRSQKFIYLAKVNVTPLKSKMNSSVKSGQDILGKMKNTLIVDLGQGGAIKNLLANAGLPEATIAEIETEVTAVVSPLSGENASAKTRQNNILKKGNENILKLNKEIVLLQDKHRSRLSELKKIVTSKIGTPFDAKAVGTTINAALETLDKRVKFARLEQMRIKEKELIISRPSNVTSEGDPKEEITRKALELVENIEKSHSTIKQFASSAELLNDSYSETEQKQAVIQRFVDTVWIFPVFGDNDDIQVTVVTKFAIVGAKRQSVASGVKWGAITSNPTNATVIVDDSIIVFTPAKVPFYPATGTHTIFLYKAGFHPQLETVTLAEAAEYSFSLVHASKSRDDIAVTETSKSEPEQAELVAPKKTLLSVSGINSGSVVQLDGSALSTDSLTNIEVTPGTHTIAVTKDGFLPFKQALTIEKGAHKSITVSLVPTPIEKTVSKDSYLVTTPAGATVMLGADTIGVSPLLCEFNEEVSIVFSLNGFDDSTITVTPGKLDTITITLAKAVGVTDTDVVTENTSVSSYQFIVNTKPEGVAVLVDGEFMGKTPLKELCTVATATPAITLQKEGYEEKSREVTLSEGSIDTFNVKLDPVEVAAIDSSDVKVGKLFISANIKDASIYVDDSLVGKGHVELEDLVAGYHSIKVAKKDHSTYTVDTLIARGRDVSIYAKISEERKKIVGLLTSFDLNYLPNQFSDAAIADSYYGVRFVNEDGFLTTEEAWFDFDYVEPNTSFDFTFYTGSYSEKKSRGFSLSGEIPREVEVTTGGPRPVYLKSWGAGIMGDALRRLWYKEGLFSVELGGFYGAYFKTVYLTTDNMSDTFTEDGLDSFSPTKFYASVGGLITRFHVGYKKVFFTGQYQYMPSFRYDGFQEEAGFANISRLSMGVTLHY